MGNKNENFLEQCNPQQNLYCICYSFEDYYYILNKSNNEYFSGSSIFCFVTYFPFVKFFFDLIFDLLSNFFEKKLILILIINLFNFMIDKVLKNRITVLNECEFKSFGYKNIDSYFFRRVKFFFFNKLLNIKKIIFKI